MSFTVALQPAQREFTVEGHETILAAALRQGVGLPHGCREGACGSCKCRLLRGEVAHATHQDKALSAAEAAAGLILTCCAVPQTDCVLEARGVSGVGVHPVLRMPCRVQGIERAAPDVAVLRLQLPASQNLQYRAGQYLDVILQGGARRSYSLATAPHLLGDPPTVELHVRHLPGGLFTDHVFGALKERDILRIEGPHGGFFLNEESTRPIVLLASGTGFAPVQAMLAQLERLGGARPVVLYWGGRRLADLYRHAWCAELARSTPWLRYVPVLSEPHASDAWSGRTGLVHEAVMHDWPDLAGHEVYACGVPAMVEAARRDFTQRCALPADAFHADAFTSRADQTAAS